MKKILTFLLMFQFLALTGVVYAQNCDFHIRTEVTQATCYNNGKVLIIPVDNDGNELFIAENTASENKENNLSTIKYGWIRLSSGIDTVQQWSFENLLVLDTGRYVVGAQVICFDSTKSGDERYTVLEAYDTVTITTSYVKPKLSLIAEDATTREGYGTVPTLVCTETGRVQLRLYDGRFPYMIRLCDVDKVPYDTINFPSNQYSGTDKNRYDYHEYYSIENLSKGTYYFFVEDGCDYHLPMIWQNVGEVQAPRITNIHWFDWSGSYADSNVIRTQITVNLPNAYYSDPQYVQYRFIHKDINGITDTTDWKYVPNMQNLKTGDNTVIVYDTISNAKGYCDIYGKDIVFQARMTACKDTINLERKHKWNYPTNFYTYDVWVADNTWPYYDYF